MGRKTLDRDRYHALVYGDEKRKFYQDGIFFDGAGNALDSGDTASPEPEGEDQTVASGGKSNSDKVAKLNELHVSKLKGMAARLAEQLGKELPENLQSGTGLKGRLVTYIAENTS